MILVVGLGNPGPRYAKSRHNLGFQVAERLVARASAAAWRERFSGEFALVELGREKVGVLKPLTYMNESGRSVQPAAAFYKIDPESLLVVHDELDLPFADVRLKSGGGDAGNRGVRSVVQHMNTADFARLRLGIGHPPPEFRGGGADFVLEAFAPAERAGVETMLDRAVGAVELFVERGLAAAMNQTNQRPKT